MLSKKSSGRLALNLRDSSEMVIDEYHKLSYHQRDLGATTLCTPSNAAKPRQLQSRQLLNKFSALKSQSTSLESRKRRRSSQSQDEEMRSAERGSSYQPSSLTNSHSSTKRRRMIDSGHLQQASSLQNQNGTSQFFPKKLDCSLSYMLAGATDTTRGDTMLGLTANMEEGQPATNTTLFPNQQEPSAQVTQLVTGSTNIFSGENEQMVNLQQAQQAKAHKELPYERMVYRWKQEVERQLPAIDLIDLAAEHDFFFAHKRQFAPEYSQWAYLTMRNKEFAIGDYLDWQQGALRVSCQARRHMITLIEDLNRLKNYKEETLYLAASLVDRYLVNLAVKNLAAPCLIKLAVIATLMAAKLEEPIQPSYNRMLRLVATEWNVSLVKKELIELEDDIICQLDFDLHFTGPVPFLERFQRIYNLDQLRRDQQANTLDFLARNFCRVMLRSRDYLALKPSQVAAAALLLVINLSSSDLALRCGLKKLSDSNLKSLFCDNLKNIEIERAQQRAHAETGPLNVWNKLVRSTTKLTIGEDLRPAYVKLCTLINQNELQGQLMAFPNLFLLESEEQEQHADDCEDQPASKQEESAK